MKTKIVTAVAAALIAGVAGITLATGASAAPVKLKLSGLCTTVFGGIISKPGYSSFSGWRSGVYCLRHAVGTNHSTRPVRAVGAANFGRYKGLSATPFNLVKCMKSVVIVHLYKHTAAGWKRVQVVKAKAVPSVSGGKIKKCAARAGTGYALGSTSFRTIVFAFDHQKNATNRLLSSLVRSHPSVH